MDPVESPDGKRLTFSAMTHLYTMDLPSGKPQRLTSGNTPEFQPAWSPDGKSIAYVTWSSEGGRLLKISAAGGTPAQLSNRWRCTQPAWSPDGTKIVLLRGNTYDRENSTLMAGKRGMRTWCGFPRRVAMQPDSAGAGRGGPHFTKEKDRIYVYTPQDSSRCATTEPIGAITSS